MKKRVLLLLTCAILALTVACAASFVVSADTDTGTDTTESTDSSETTDAPGGEEPEPSFFVLEFLRGDHEPVVMTVNGTECSCTVTLDGGEAYPFVIKNSGSVMRSAASAMHTRTSISPALRKHWTLPAVVLLLRNCSCSPLD